MSLIIKRSAHPMVICSLHQTYMQLKGRLSPPAISHQFPVSNKNLKVQNISDPTNCIMPTFFSLLYIKCRSIPILSITHLLNSHCKYPSAEMSPGYPVIQHLESFTSDASSLISSTEPSSPALQYNDESLIVGTSQVASANLDFETLSLRDALCHFCKGKKYSFTSYFHNTKIFFRPPHEVLPVVEQSYILKDRLKSLLVTYAMRDLEQDQIQNIQTQILNWKFRVEVLIDEVMSSACNAGFILNRERLDDVQKWTDIILDEARYYVSGKATLKMPSSRLAAVMLEYRKVWETVWIGYLQDRSSGQSDVCTSGCTACM